MKRFISGTAAVLALGATPAQAMDYVKCEAMNKMAARIRFSIGEIRSSVGGQSGVAMRNACADHQKEFDTYLSSGEHEQALVAIRAYNTCSEQWMAANDGSWEQKKQAASAIHRQRLAQVQRDYEAAGCY